MKPLLISVAAPLALAILSGCASLSPDGGVEGIRDLTLARTKHEPALLRTDAERARAAESVRARLQNPMTAEDAVAIAMLRGPRVQVVLAELGVSEAELVQAGRIRNPGFSWAKFRRGDEREIERRIVLDVVGLLTIPIRVQMERGNFAAAQARAALEVVRVADEARRAWIEAVAAVERAAYAEQVKNAAEAGATLATRMAQAGNFSRLSQSREQLFHAEAVAQLVRARHAETAARESLARALGLEGEDLAFRLPARLPDPPAAPRVLEDAESIAIASRLDVQGAKREAEAVARSLGLSRVTRFVNVLHLGYEWGTSNEEPRRTGYEIELELPIFDWGDARSARAEAIYRQALGRAAETALRARSEVREGFAAYRTAYDLAKHYRDEIVPLRKKISEENLLRYNGMLIGVFELLADSREQVSSVIASIEATRDFWVAEANLETALLTGSPERASTLKSTTPPAASAGRGH